MIKKYVLAVSLLSVNCIASPIQAVYYYCTADINNLCYSVMIGDKEMAHMGTTTEVMPNVKMQDIILPDTETCSNIDVDCVIAEEILYIQMRGWKTVR